MAKRVISTVDRNPFARADLYRETMAKEDRGSCDWCGAPAKFRYAWISDTTPAGEVLKTVKGKFCSIGCWRAYDG